MPDGVTVAAILLVAGPLVGSLGVGAVPALWRAWTAPRDEHLALVRAHRLGWALANTGFTVATVATAGGLVVLAGSLAGDPVRRAVLTAVAVAYAIGGALWVAAQGIRLRTTPALADLAAAGVPTQPAETILGAAVGGLFTAFTLVTAAALVVLGLALGLTNEIPTPVAFLAILLALVQGGLQIRNGDSIPAVLYGPTVVVGAVLLAVQL
jgi:hypothetical protein